MVSEVPSGLDDRVDESLRDLAVVLGGEGSEDLSLFAATHR